MKFMTKLETIIMNRTGCNQETANLVANDILAEVDKENEDNPRCIEFPIDIDGVFYGLQETQCFAYSVCGYKWGRRRGTDDKFVLIVLTVYEMEFIWGEEAFATEEEAERALKARWEEFK